MQNLYDNLAFFQILNNTGQIITVLFWINGDIFLRCQKQDWNFYENTKLERLICVYFRRFL